MLQEFEEEGRVETAKALEKLRQYCSENEEEVLDAVKDTSRFASAVAMTP